jgi:hypothetical protein
MRSFANQFRRDDAAEELRRQILDDQMIQSGENTTAALLKLSTGRLLKQALSACFRTTGLRLISAIAGLAAVIQNKS